MKLIELLHLQFKSWFLQINVARLKSKIRRLHDATEEAKIDVAYAQYCLDVSRAELAAGKN